MYTKSPIIRDYCSADHLTYLNACLQCLFILKAKSNSSYTLVATYTLLTYHETIYHATLLIITDRI